MARDSRIVVERQQDLGAGYHLITMLWPELAAEVRAGQFVMLGLPDLTEMLIRRPFSVARVHEDEAGSPSSFDVLYRIYGRGTLAFSRLRAGAELSVLGPLGRGFWLPEGRDSPARVLMVAGGIGNAPFPLLLQQLGGSAARARMLFGGRSSADLTLLDWFRERCEVVVSTEDGSLGRKGLVTEPLVELLDGAAERPDVVFACGPTPMLRAVSTICLERDVPCQLAVEETMACGFGVCLGCVIPKRSPESEFERFVRVCKEGPVFDAREIVL